MIIRDMVRRDAEEVAQIERAAFSQPWSAQGFLESLANPNTLFLVAQVDDDAIAPAARENASPDANGAIAGYIGMYQALDEGEITNVAVAAEFRRRGIGTMLIDALIKKAKNRGVTRIVLEVRTGNAPAIALYEQMGFRRIGTRKGFYDFPKEDADIMEWTASADIRTESN